MQVRNEKNVIPFNDPRREKFISLVGEFNLITDYKEKLELYLSNYEFLSNPKESVLGTHLLEKTNSLTYNDEREIGGMPNDFDYYISIEPKNMTERLIYANVYLCLGMAKNYELTAYDKYDFKGTLELCLQKETAKFEHEIKINGTPQEYVEKGIKDNTYEPKYYRYENNRIVWDKSIEEEIYNSLLGNEVIDYDRIFQYVVQSNWDAENYQDRARGYNYGIILSIVKVHLFRFFKIKLEQLINPSADKVEDKNKKDVRTPHNFKVINVFEDTSKYVKIRDILVNKEYLEPITFIWKDTSNGHKSTLINIIKTLHLKGFFQNSHVITNEFCIDLVKNTYGIEVGVSTAEKVKPNLDFIPYSTTI